MIMMSAGLVGILIVLAHWNSNLGQPVFAVTSEYCVLSGEAVHAKFRFYSLWVEPTGGRIHDDLQHFESSTLSIIPPMLSVCVMNKSLP